MVRTHKKESPGLRKTQIISAADLVLLEVGIDKFTVDQVIHKASIAKGTVYRYYKNKDEMLSELCLKALQLLLSSFKSSTEKEKHYVDKLKAICYAHYDFTVKYKAYSNLISYIERPEFDIHTQKYVKMSGEINDYVTDLIKAGQEQGQIRDDLNPQTMTYVIWASNVGVVQFVESKKKLLKNHHELKTRDMVNAFADMLTSGIKR